MQVAQRRLKPAHLTNGVTAWTLQPHAQVEAGAARYFRGRYIRQSLQNVGSKDASYFYLQLTLNL